LPDKPVFSPTVKRFQKFSKRGVRHHGDGVENDCTLAAWMLLKLSQYQIAFSLNQVSEALMRVLDDDVT